MTSPIVAGFDPRTRDAGPVRFALAAARFSGAPLVVVTVCAAPETAPYLMPAEDGLLSDAGGALEELKSQLDADGALFESRTLYAGSAPQALHDVAEREDAALLVVGSTARGAVGRVLPGSTAERLMHGAPCPIAVVPHDWSGGDRPNVIGVAYVDTPEGRSALRGAHALALRSGATLRVLTVVRVGAGAHRETEATRPAHPGKGFSGIEGEHRVRAEAMVREAVSALGSEVPVEVDAFLEDPVDVLVGVSEHLDLLVCGSRGYGPLRAVLLGGVTRRVTAAARCPVLVLPRGVELLAEDSGDTTTAPAGLA